MFSATVRARVIDSLEGTPEVLAYVLSPLSSDDVRWRARPDSGRYSLQEILAHLADWDVIWLGRLKMTVGGAEPNFAAYDVQRRAVEQGYAAADPLHSLALLGASRPDMVSFLRALTSPEWKRVAFHPEEGRQSIETQSAWILAHDDYYVKLAVRLLTRFSENEIA